MRLLLVFCLLVVILLPLSLRAQQQSQVLTNDDIVTMLKAGLTPEIVMAKIKSSRCDFDTSPSALAELKKENVPDSVILAMIEAPRNTEKVYVKCNYAPISLQQANQASTVLAKLGCNEALTVLDKSDNLYWKVRSEQGTVGYVVKSFVSEEKQSEPTNQAAPQEGSTTGSAPSIKCDTGGTGVDVLESPSGPTSTTRLKCGEKITILTERAVPYGWYRIRTQDGKEGYVSQWVVDGGPDSSQQAPGTAQRVQSVPMLARSTSLRVDMLRALAWRGVPWATTSYYQQPGNSYTGCTGQGQWLGNFFQSNFSCTSSYTPAQTIPVNWYHYTIYNLVETSDSYLVLTCTRNWRFSKCSYLVPGNTFFFEYKKGQAWVTGQRGGKGKGETLKLQIVATQPKTSP